MGVGDLRFTFELGSNSPFDAKFESNPRFVFMFTFAFTFSRFEFPFSERLRESAQNPKAPTTRSAKVPKIVSTTTFSVFDFGGG